tara:strand:- start:2803 stop:3267 length:465 start_codon:yes stop_codon:yes gene_type:complete
MKKNFTFIIIFLFLSSCGFKVINLSELNDYYISEVKTEGEEKINFIIKNKLLNSFGDENKKNIVIKLSSNKIKTIKEKNINNQITKFEIKISTQVTVLEAEQKKLNFTIYKNGDYLVASRHTNTLRNEKNLVKLLTTNLTNEVLNQLTIKLHDL